MAVVLQLFGHFMALDTYEKNSSPNGHYTHLNQFQNGYAVSPSPLSVTLCRSLYLHSRSCMQQTTPLQISSTAGHDQSAAKRCIPLTATHFPSLYTLHSPYSSWSKKSVISFSMKHPQTAFVRIEQTVQFSHCELGLSGILVSMGQSNINIFYQYFCQVDILQILYIYTRNQAAWDLTIVLIILWIQQNINNFALQMP